MTVQPHPDPLATTQDFQEHAICEIDGKVGATQAAILPVASGADTHDVKRLLLAEVRVAVFHMSSYAWTGAYAEGCQKWLCCLLCRTTVILFPVMETNLPNAVSSQMIIPIFGHPS